MEKSGLFARLAGGFLTLLFIVYIGFQLLSNMDEKITTVDAVVVTVEEVISAEGVFVRSQILARGESGKTADYLAGDGEKVAKGQPLVVFFDNASAAGAYQKLSAVTSKLEGLKTAYQSLTGGSDGKKLDSLIYLSMKEITSQLEAGSVEKAAREYSGLQQLIVSRNAAAASREDYAARIAALEAERDTYQAAVSGASHQTGAEKSGYFFRHADGFETIFTPESIKHMSPEQILSATPDSSAFASDVIGTITDSYEWFYAAILTGEQADQIKNRSNAGVYFPQLSSRAISLSLVSVTTYGEQAVAILKSGVMHSDYLSARRQPADIVVNSYTGIKVPKSALRQIDGEWGVFVLEGAVYRFKPIEWVYQTDTYYLVPSAKDSKSGLYMYDKIIIGGKGLEDSMVAR